METVLHQTAPPKQFDSSSVTKSKSVFIVRGNYDYWLTNSLHVHLYMFVYILMFFCVVGLCRDGNLEDGLMDLIVVMFISFVLANLDTLYHYYFVSEKKNKMRNH